MTSRLSSLLVRDGIVTIKRMERAFQRQVMSGGGLDTVLLELGLVPESRLIEYVALASGLPPATAADIEAIDRARTAIEAQRPQIEAARAAIEAQRGTIAAQIAQLAQDQRRIVIPQVQRLETRELTPEERAALDKARGELSAAQAKMREAQKALSEASAEMAKAQSEVLKHQLRPGCFGAEADGRCKLLFAPGAALTPDGAGLAFLKPGQPFRFPEGWPADKLTVRPFDGELLKKMRPFPEGLDFKCDQSDAGVLRCRPEPRGEKKPD